MLVRMGRSVTPRHHPDYRYPGLRGDLHGGMTDIGAIIRDAWVLGVLPETQDCRGWPLADIRRLHAQVDAAWAPYQHRVSCLPPALRARYVRIHAEHTRHGRERGWQPVTRIG
jgi:hypothetical protein